MALPLLFIGAAVATGAVGGTKTIKAVSDNSKAGQINQIANQSVMSLTGSERKLGQHWNLSEKRNCQS